MTSCADRTKAGEDKLAMITALQKAVNTGGNYRGQLVAAMRDTGEFDLDNDKAAVLEIVSAYLDREGREAGRRVLAVALPPG
jgi:hypothetical protein